MSERDIQRQYYQENASQYDQMHLKERDEHYFSLSYLSAFITHFEIKSVLDIGSGTGRALRFLKTRHPNVHIVGIEPVGALREIAYANGINEEELVFGDATNLPYANSQFDCVCEFGVLHHVRNPEIVVKEMLRTAKVCVFISDSNNFGQGSFLSRTIKQTANALGLWPALNFIKTRGKGYTLSEGDGLAYSYSVYSNYSAIIQCCQSIHIVNTMGSARNPYRSAGHVALLGLKKQG